MNVYFSSKKLSKTLQSEKGLNRAYGVENAKKIKQRLVELEAAPNLKEVYNLPMARCHELSGNKKGQFAVDIKHPYRLIFEPDHIEVPRKEDGGIDLVRVTEIRVISIEDYH
jgi:proteic killer suppression protein